MAVVKLLLDTHALLWWLFDDPKLSSKASTAIADPENDVLVSAASAWEISTKHRVGKLPEAGDVVTRLPKYIREARFLPLEITIDHALAAGRLPGPHRDPFDRMLIAQAHIENLPIVTNDKVFEDYSSSVIW